jgi:hypothetical protein
MFNIGLASLIFDNTQEDSALGLSLTLYRTLNLHV